MGCPRGMSTIRYTRLSYKKILMEKKNRFSVFVCNNDCLFTREMHSEVFFLPEKRS